MTAKPFRPMPKPVKLPRPSRDPAQPSPSALEAIWGELPRCPLTGFHEFIDPAHILGRGEAYGYKWIHRERRWFSSPFNIVPLYRIIHQGPYRDTVELRRLFLRIAADHVYNASRLGLYRITDNDQAFLDFVKGIPELNP